jgi:glycosyltransferase involved in cell wall biosynthesis
VRVTAVTRRILLLTSRFPPDLGVGTVRPSHLAELLPERGFAVDVVTRPTRPRTIADPVDTDYGGIGGHTRVRYLDIEPHRPQPGLPTRLSWRWVAELSVPDGDIVFMRLWEDRLRAVVEELAPDLVISTSPKHSLHHGGRLASRVAGVPWVADFRDPLVDDPRYGPLVGLRRYRRRGFERYERRIYEDAALVVHTVPTHHRIATERHRDLATPKVLITNGFPPELPALCAAPRRPGPLRLCLAGKTPEAEFTMLIAAVERLVAEGHDLELVNMGEQPATVDAIAAERLRSRYVGLGHVPHSTAIGHIAEADVLLSILSAERSRMMLLSSKLFEYGATGRPIVLVRPTADDRELLASHPSAVVIDEPSDDALEAGLRQALLDLGPAPDTWLAAFRSTYDRRALVMRYADELDRLLGGPPAFDS